MAQVSIVWNAAAVQVACEDPSNGIGRAMSQIADRAVSSMKRHCPVSPVSSGRSGTLRSSITKFRQPDGSYLIGPTATVGPPWQPPQFLGPLVEGGTGPHPIDSHGPYPLRDKAGRIFGRPVYIGPAGHKQLHHWHVNHPGTPAQKFVEPAARELAGIRITIT